MTIQSRLQSIIASPLPLPGSGHTLRRHQMLMEIGREDLSLARLAEAHFDAVAILAEAGHATEDGALYGVWASEKPGHALQLEPSPGSISGVKMFCSGAGIVDRALITVGSPDPLLLDVDVRNTHVACDYSAWKTSAFAETGTATVTFSGAPVDADKVIGDPGWYLERPGFWHGACGPAACWAGGAIGLVDWALTQKRGDPHTLAHLGAMQASAWALNSFLTTAGQEIDQSPMDATQARPRALALRHLVEQACTDILRRLPRAYGPYPLAMLEDVARRYQELDLYLRQSHAESDLEDLGRRRLPQETSRAMITTGSINPSRNETVVSSTT